MTSAIDNEELPLPLLKPRGRRSGANVANEAEGDTTARRDYRASRRSDRLRPATAGAITGLLGGAAGLGVVHALHVGPISQGIARLGASLGVPPDGAVPLAYLAAALGGALVGAGFASVTRYLRRSFVALLFWAIVFFVSLTTLALAISSAYGRGIGVAMAPAILLGAGAYAIIVAFELPLRRRR